MMRFAVLFLSLFALFYGVLFGSNFAWVMRWHAWEQYAIMAVLSQVVPPERIDTFSVWILPTYKVVITPLCDGLLPILVWWAYVWARSASIPRKLLWSLIGYAVLHAVNLMRIVAVVWIEWRYKEPSYFFYVHDLFGNLLLVVTVLALAWYFNQKVADSWYNHASQRSS